MKPALSILIFLSLAAVNSISDAEEALIPPRDQNIIFVVSRSVITDETAGSHLDQELAFDAWLKYDLVKRLDARGLRAVSSDLE